MDCIFCRIIKRELPASAVYEDERALAFLDLHPINQGHVLVVPKRHKHQFTELNPSEAAHLFSVGQKILKALQKSEIRCEGANLFLSDGPVAGQEVMHSHLHVVPRFADDGQKVGFTHAGSVSRTDLDQIAAQIAKHLPKEEIIPQPTLETMRLILEPFKESDLQDIFAYVSHPDVPRYVPWQVHKTIEDSRVFYDFIQQSTRAIRGYLFYVFAIRLKESGRVIGSIDFKNTSPLCGQIDYALGYEYWNKGIMAEAAMAIREWAFANLPEMVRLQAFCAFENIGSSRVMEKIGMSKEGVRKKAFVLKGVPVDVADYALIRS